MAPKLLVAAFAAEDRSHVDNAIRNGVDVRILDCFEDTHAQVQSWYKHRCIHVPAHRLSVKGAVQQERFDMAVIREGNHDFVRTALLAQTLRDAKVEEVVVLSGDHSKIPIYRRCGAHQVIVSENPLDFWAQFDLVSMSHVSA